MGSRFESLKASLSKTQARARTRGWGEVLNEGFGQVRSAVRSNDELLFLLRDAVWNGKIARKTNEPLRFVRATADDANDYERFVGTDSARTFKSRLSEQTNCWLIHGRGMVLHASWTTSGAAWTREIQRLFVAPPGAAYIYESFTRPEARGLGLYPLALGSIGEALAAEGIERLFVGVEADNAPSVRAITKAGFEPAFSVRYRRHLGRLTIDEADGPKADLAEKLLRAR
jgi:GNAT superfamily N-acetyltransferase